jgi:hypothetical protein
MTPQANQAHANNSAARAALQFSASDMETRSHASAYGRALLDDEGVAELS